MDLIPKKDWLKWVETGNASDRLLLQVALKIRSGQGLGEQEASIYVFHAKEIELILKDL